jgi:hypothetical protein
MSVTRYQFIEKILRDVYGDMPNDDSVITFNLVNIWLSEGIGLAARKNATDNIQLEGVSFVNNSFYSSFKGLSITNDSTFLYKVLLPEVPIGIGKNEGVASLKFINGSQKSPDAIPLSANQVGYVDGMRLIPNKVLYWSEGDFLYIKSITNITQYTANIRLISGGDSSNLDSTLNVPPDYLPLITDYIVKNLMMSRSGQNDKINDGVDSK